MQWAVLGFAMTLVILCAMDEVGSLQFATLAGSLAKFAEGAFLGVSVYLASKGVCRI